MHQAIHIQQSLFFKINNRYTRYGSSVVKCPDYGHRGRVLESH